MTSLQERLTGCIIDSLIGVTTIETEQFEGNVDMGANIRTDYITGMVKQEKRVIIILNMDMILKNDEMAVLDQSVGVVTPEAEA